MTLDQIRKQLKDRNLAAVAQGAGVSYPRLVRLANGKTKNPSFLMVNRVVAYLERGAASD